MNSEGVPSGQPLLCPGGWCITELGFVLSDKLGFEFGVASEALRFRPIVLFAPVALLLEIGGQLRAALSTNSFRDAVLNAPPSTVF